jgi:hypothetical protein
MRRHCSEFRISFSAEAQLAHRRFEKLRKIQAPGQFIQHLSVFIIIDPVYISQKAERIYHRHVEPELRALAEYDADLPEMLPALFPRVSAH